MSQRQTRLETILKEALAPTYLSVENESNRHQVPKGAESHFKVTAVSAQFIHKSRIERHRWLNQLLAKEFGMGLHALSLHLYTPEEWLEIDKQTLRSPPCNKKTH